MSVLLPPPDKFEGFCPIEPVPKGRPRFNSRTRTTYTPAATQKYEKAVRKFLEKNYGDRMPMDGPLLARYEFIMPKPKNTPKKKVFDDRKPDIDNLVKAFQDAMDFKRKSSDGVLLGVIANDSRVACVQSLKRYAEEGEQTGTRFSIEALGTTVVVLSTALSPSMAAMVDKCYPQIWASELETAKNDPVVKHVYVFLAGEDDTETDEIVALVKKKFPNIAKLSII